MGVFELVARHFAFDDPGDWREGGAGQQLAQDFGGDAGLRVGDDLRGKNPGGLRSFGELPGVIG